VVVFGISYLLMKAIAAIPGEFNLRVSKDGELEGLDIHEHGTPAYHMEFGYGMTYSSPTGASSSGRPPNVSSNRGEPIGSTDPPEQTDESKELQV